MLVLCVLALVLLLRWPGYQGNNPSAESSYPVQPAATSGTSVSILSSTAAYGGASTSTPRAWATYVDPGGLFSFEYPGDQAFYVTTSTFAGPYPATGVVFENTEAAEGGDNSLNLQIVPDDPKFKTVSQSAGTFESDISNPGVAGQLYEASDGTMIAFFESTAEGITSTFELTFGIPAMALTPDIQPLPDYWRSVLNSFRILPGT